MLSEPDGPPSNDQAAGSVTNPKNSPCRKRAEKKSSSRHRPELPAIAAVASVPAIAAVTTATTATASTTATTMAATATAVTATTATTTAALCLRPRFVHDEIASSKILAVHGVDRAVGFFVIGNFDECKTA